MINDNPSLAFHQGQDHNILHGGVSNVASTFETGWIFFSIALASSLIFSIFAALSTSFYCCEKTRKKEPYKSNQSSYNEGNSQQRLFFPSVPSTVYPKTHSILQQEENEVVESLLPAYRELPSTYLGDLSRNDSTVSSDIGDMSRHNHSTTLPNSTRSLRKCYTTSLSSERLENGAGNLDESAVIPMPDCASDHDNRSQSAPGLRSGSDVSIRVASSRNPEACMTSSTSGVLSGDELITQTFEEKTTLAKIFGLPPERLLPGVNSVQDAREDGGHSSSEEQRNEFPNQDRCSGSVEHGHWSTTRQPFLPRLTERHCRSTDWESRKREKTSVETRCFSEGKLPKTSKCHSGERLVAGTTFNKQATPTSNVSQASCQDKVNRNGNKYNKNEMIDDTSRGASSFGENLLVSDDDLLVSGDNGLVSGSDRLISRDSRLISGDSNYYALTFCREESILSDKDENSSMRGASVFACQSKEACSKNMPGYSDGRQSVDAGGFYEGRGASVFGMHSMLPRSQVGNPCPESNEDTTQQRALAMGSSSAHPSTVSNSMMPCPLKYQSLDKSISLVEYQPRGYEGPMKRDQLVVTNQIDESELGGQDSFLGNCHENDTLCESVSLSFAYESPSEDEMASHFVLKEN